MNNSQRMIYVSSLHLDVGVCTKASFHVTVHATPYTYTQVPIVTHNNE